MSCTVLRESDYTGARGRTVRMISTTAEVREQHRFDPATLERAAIYDSLNEVQARLHTVDWQALGLADFGKPGNYFARQIHRWTQQYRASETEKIEAMERLIAWMPEHVPPGDETTLVHG